MTAQAPAAAPRLVSRLWVAGAAVVMTLLVAVCLLLTVVSTGAAQLGWAFLLLAAVLATVVVVVGVVWPRSGAPLRPDPDGAVRLAAPGVLVGAAVGAYLAVLATAVVWACLFATGSPDAPRAAPGGAVVLGAVVSLPELVRLVTGRLHRWRLVLDDEGITYQGYRSRVSEPWSAVKGASVQQQSRRPRRAGGVLVDLKASRPDLLVPWSAFLVRPEVLAAEIERRVGSR